MAVLSRLDPPNEEAVEGYLQNLTSAKFLGKCPTAARYPRTSSHAIRRERLLSVALTAGPYRTSDIRFRLRSARIERCCGPLLEALSLLISRFHHHGRGHSFGGSVRALLKGFSDDATWVILAGVELFPVHVVKVRAQLFTHATFSPRSHVPKLPNKAAELSGVGGKSVGAN